MLGRITHRFENKKRLLSIILKGYTYIILNIHIDVNTWVRNTIKYINLKQKDIFLGDVKTIFLYINFLLKLISINLYNNINKWYDLSKQKLIK
ncbi:hypothetical protein CSC2_40550 [Clostridium zeae]|uniref:Uncharacterized protein n=1 Tax=Clostridium zeae TaxID=2759022 RepID=A0ABQ1EFE9_9CLOT|nr:hypothetical protein CSC2_40550 [Clostridium zeae]